VKCNWSGFAHASQRTRYGEFSPPIRGERRSDAALPGRRTAED